jgi:hypothetical protein
MNYADSYTLSFLKEFSDDRIMIAKVKWLVSKHVESGDGLL